MAFAEGNTTDTVVVGFPLYQGVTLVDFAGATQVFSFAFAGGFQPIWLAQNMDPVETSERVKVLPSASFANAPPIDILFVPGGDARSVAAMMFDGAYQGFLKIASQNAKWSGAVCVGSFILAAARLLDNCEATTYWSQIPNLEMLKGKFGIKVASGFPRSVIDHGNKRFSGGGVSSSFDLALDLVRLVAGQEIAESAQLNIQYAPNPPVHAGDPTQASPILVANTRRAQEANFLTPIRDAVKQLISS